MVILAAKINSTEGNAFTCLGYAVLWLCVHNRNLGIPNFLVDLYFVDYVTLCRIYTIKSALRKHYIYNYYRIIDAAIYTNR